MTYTNSVHLKVYIYYCGSKQASRHQFIQSIQLVVAIINYAIYREGDQVIDIAVTGQFRETLIDRSSPSRISHCVR